MGRAADRMPDRAAPVLHGLLWAGLDRRVDALAVVPELPDTVTGTVSRVRQRELVG